MQACRRWLLSTSLRLPSDTVYSIGQACWRQCNSLTIVRMRSVARHTIEFYGNLYRQQLDTNLLAFARTVLRRRQRSLGTLLSAVIFSLHKDGITDEDLNRKTVEMDADLAATPPVTANDPTSHLSAAYHDKSPACSSEWELLVDNADFLMYRRPSSADPYIFEYKCIGRYFDVTPTSFFQAQIDIDYRKTWDGLVIKLDVLDVNDRTGDEVVRWVTHFPFPMYSREYVFVRRSCIDEEDRRMIVATRSIEDHPDVPLTDKHVRVFTYESTMLIRPHTQFDSKGMDYVLTYIDDPKAPFPGPAYKWMVRYGVAGYVGQVHDAAVQLDARKVIDAAPNVDTA